jgi:hypothetical protein
MAKAIDKPIYVRNELAKIAGVSNGTYSQGKRILDSDNEEVKQKVLSGEMKIGTAYNELFGNKEIKNNNIKEIVELEMNHSSPEDLDKTRFNKESNIVNVLKSSEVKNKSIPNFVLNFIFFYQKFLHFYVFFIC